VKRVALALLGPTASGKSRLALDLARSYPLEIVGVDSGQVYRGMDIGTAKPSVAERAQASHHLIDLVDPGERYSAGRFREDALGTVEGILRRGRIPLLVGGTMLYYRALADGLDRLPQADAKVRAQIAAEAAQRGWAALHAELAAVDPAAARRIPPADAQRIQRALEVWRLTGRPISELQRGAGSAPPFELRAFALLPPDRAALHARIAERFDGMLRAGLVDEVNRLRKEYALTADLPSMRCVGYRQVWRYLERQCTESEMRDAAIAATRQLAKRQLTWLRGLPGIEPVPRLEPALRAALE